MQLWLVWIGAVGEQRLRVARCATRGTVEQLLTASRRGLIETSCRRRGRLQTELILQQGGKRNRVCVMLIADPSGTIVTTYCQ